MPHIVVEYSANLDEAISIADLIGDVHGAVLATGAFKLGAVRTRAARRDVFMVADGDPRNAFINVIARIGRGRDVETRKGLAAAIMGALERATAQVWDAQGLALSVYVEEIDEDGALRKNNLHARLAGPATPRTAAE